MLAEHRPGQRIDIVLPPDEYWVRSSGTGMLLMRLLHLANGSIQPSHRHRGQSCRPIHGKTGQQAGGS